MDRNRERSILYGILKAHGVTRETTMHLPQLVEALCVEGVDEIVRSRLSDGERTPDSEHVKALKEAGIYPADQVMVKYVDLRAKRGGFDVDALFTAAVEWKARGFNPRNLAGICDWAEFGIDTDGPARNRKARA